MQKLIFFLIVILGCIASVKCGSTSADERSYPHIFISANILYSDLASGASFTLYSAVDEFATYRILSVVTDAASSTVFSGGDRNIYIGTDSEPRWLVSSTSLLSAGITSYSNAQGFDPSNTYNAIGETSAGSDIIIKYTGGTSDHTSGELVIEMVIIQTTE